MQQVRRGFSMLELLFVIIILGIVGGIALEVVRQYYDGIYRTKVYMQRIDQAEHILNQLSKYFENSIDLSITNFDQDALDNALIGDCVGDPTQENEGTASDYTTVMIGVETDSLRVQGKPGWSETVPSPFTGTLLTMNDANLTQADRTIKALYPASDLNHSAIYNFEGAVDTCNDFYMPNGNAYFSITSFTANTLTINNNAGTLNPRNIRKYLLRTGYAFRVLNTGEFVMYSNFRPWIGEIYSNGERNIIGQNVASFYADFNSTDNLNTRGTLWTLKVCMRGLDTSLADSDNVEEQICRERKVHVRY